MNDWSLRHAASLVLVTMHVKLPRQTDTNLISVFFVRLFFASNTRAPAAFRVTYRVTQTNRRNSFGGEANFVRKNAMSRTRVFQRPPFHANGVSAKPTWLQPGFATTEPVHEMNQFLSLKYRLEGWLHRRLFCNDARKLTRAVPLLCLCFSL